MKAAVFDEHGGPDGLRITDLEVPEPGPGEVRIEVRAAGLNHLDLWVRRGLPFAVPMPHIGGSDVAGLIHAVGPGVDGVQEGTRVVLDPSLHYDWYDAEPRGSSIAEGAFGVYGEHTQGGFAQYCVAPAANILEIPEGVPFETAAAASLAGVTAYHGLFGRGGLQPGERVLITGASGGVSTIGIQLAKHAGAKVYAVTSGAENCERVRGLGADHVYDRLDGDWSRALYGDTGKRGVNLVLDSVGSPSWAQCLKALSVSGRLVSFGGTGGPRVESDIRVIFWKQISILGSTMGSPQEYRRVMRLVFDGAVAPVIHEVMPLGEIRRAHEMLEAGDVFGKLVLTPWS
jgi:NADPH:quinone reductase-like Zn-dependent oxidoreductase